MPRPPRRSTRSRHCSTRVGSINRSGRVGPRLALAARAIEQPGPRAPALSLLETLIGQFEKKTHRQTEAPVTAGLWENHLYHLRARATVLARPRNESARTRLGRLGPIRTILPGFGSRRRQPRAEVAASRFRTGPVETESSPITPATSATCCTCHVPLRGDFQLDCELTSSPGREIQVSYGGLAVGPKADLKHLERSQFGKPLTELTINPPLDKLAEWYRYRLVVGAGRSTSFINGRKVNEAPVLAEVDPWLALICRASQTGAARNVTISGNPTIPEKLNLSTLPGLAGWSADEYAETVTGENPDWDKRGDEIVGRLVEETRRQQARERAPLSSTDGRGWPDRLRVLLRARQGGGPPVARSTGVSARAGRGQDP